MEVISNFKFERFIYRNKISVICRGLKKKKPWTLRKVKSYNASPTAEILGERNVGRKNRTEAVVVRRAEEKE